MRPTSSTVSQYVAAALGVLCAPLALAQSSDNQSLQEQIRELQREVRELKAHEAAQQAAAQPAPAPASVPAPAPAAPASAKAPSVGIAAGPLTLTFGGFTELATIYRNRNETADVGSNFNTGIP